jgi:5-methylcytosine-specific restriction endonuclease McrA
MPSHIGRDYTLDEILPFVTPEKLSRNKVRKELDGFKVSLSSDRLAVFATKGLSCIQCGISGSVFKLDFQGNSKPHLNLYAIKPDGTEMLMTKDHIVPKSKGGRDRLDNYQTMCADCNVAKGDAL